MDSEIITKCSECKKVCSYIRIPFRLGTLKSTERRSTCCNGRLIRVKE